MFVCGSQAGRQPRGGVHFSPMAHRVGTAGLLRAAGWIGAVACGLAAGLAMWGVVWLLRPEPGTPLASALFGMRAVVVNVLLPCITTASILLVLWMAPRLLAAFSASMAVALLFGPELVLLAWAALTGQELGLKVVPSLLFVFLEKILFTNSGIGVGLSIAALLAAIYYRSLQNGEVSAAA